MLATILLLTMPIAGQTPVQTRADPPEAEEIVVRASRPGSKQCRVELDKREISERELDSRATQWAKGKGTPVRVRADAGADIRCLSKIAFQLADKGVTLIEFVDPQGRPGRFPPSTAATIQENQPQAAAGPGIAERERAFAARRASHLVLEGKCEDAKKLLLEAGDLQGAAAVVTLCRAP